MARDKGSGSVFQLPNGKWRGSIEVGWSTKGKRRRVTVTRNTKREALEALKEKQRELAIHGAPVEGSQVATTVKAFSEEWLTLQETKQSPSAFNATKAAVTNWIVPTIGTRRISQLSASDVRKVAGAVLKAGRSESTALRYQITLVKMLKDAARDGYPVPQPALLTEKVSTNKSDRTDIPLPLARRIVIVSATRPDFSRWLAAFYAGLRPAEARGLTWDRIDFDNALMEISWQLKALPYKTPRDPLSGFRVPRGYESQHLVDAWHLVRPKTKAGDRWIPIIPPLLVALRQWQQVCPPSALVWPNLTGEKAYGRPREDKPDREEWQRIAGFAGAVKDDGKVYDLYSARHTCATMLREAGTPDEVIIAILGHSTILSSRTYMHTSAALAGDWLSRAMEVLPVPEQMIQIEAHAA